RSQSDLQECSHECQRLGWTPPRFLRGFTGQGYEAFTGPSHPGAQDCGHHADCLEERSAFRRRTSETASSLSVSDRESVPSWGSFWVVISRVLETLRFEGEYPSPS